MSSQVVFLCQITTKEGSVFVGCSESQNTYRRLGLLSLKDPALVDNPAIRRESSTSSAPGLSSLPPPPLSEKTYVVIDLREGARNQRDMNKHNNLKLLEGEEKAWFLIRQLHLSGTSPLATARSWIGGLSCVSILGRDRCIYVPGLHEIMSICPHLIC